MQIDPVAEWQRLTEFYHAKTDDELEELAEDFGNLTETAQDVLKTEMRSRGLSLPGSEPKQFSAPAQVPRKARFASSADPLAFGAEMSDDLIDLEHDGNNAESDEEVPNEFTWKTLLCECETTDQAYQIRVMLHQGGIESWVDNRANSVGLSGPKILVAADQLEAAQRIAAQPIPQEIVDDLKVEVPEYIPPKCPKCHAEDPVLESTDPSNNWLCEACGALWSDPLPDPDTDSPSDPARTPK
jgi:hypothetical protein